MPVLLAEADFDRWLSGEAGTEVLKPARESALREWTVSRRVNKTGVGVDNPATIEPSAPQVSIRESDRASYWFRMGAAK